ncbi:MAG: hypothetical protein GTN76_12665 [Candidatus Aenigmarchaeota archaeon]|nr:hypothetical protein [Candidatus Aenigmarchaeota archaeon]
MSKEKDEAIKAALINYTKQEQGSISLRRDGRLIARIDFSDNVSEILGETERSDPSITITCTGNGCNEIFKIKNGDLHGDKEKYRELMKLVDWGPVIDYLPHVGKELTKYI